VSAATRRLWTGLVGPLLDQIPTPFHVASVVPIEAGLAELDHAFAGLPVRHWLSCKTQPLRPLLQWWHRQGRPIEVVSEFEFLAARAEGFPPERILVNGPAKHHWLPRHAVPGLNVNFDSVAETRVLAPLARRWNWVTGIRLNTREEHDPEAPDWPTQFGLSPAEATAAARIWRRAGVAPQIVHFHLRTNVESAAVYGRALEEVAGRCRELRLTPRFVDCGGGFPPPHVWTRNGRRVDAGFSLAGMEQVYARALKVFAGAAEIWLENGRWLSARSGALVVTVLDVKERDGRRHLICDGGRTLNALVATWEQHRLFALPARNGPSVPTTITGPTCMAFDQLARQPMPGTLRAGDRLVWLEAGAYHLPWETRFSHGLAGVAWHDGRRVQIVRERERFDDWWGQWR
jgi:diaminopimelate decarboxylase